MANINHKVVQGDCIESIAEKYGHFWQTLWDHPNNADLRARRQSPNILSPGDVVFVPEKRLKEEPCATEALHRFRKMGVPSLLHVQLSVAGKPVANEPYQLIVDGRSYSGTTDGEGNIKHEIPPGAKQAKLRIGENNEEFILDIGHLDSLDDPSGVQARLNNLGYTCGQVDGRIGGSTGAAVAEFQKKQGLPETGKIDQSTRDALKKAHGS